ncbi:3-ketoacyl-ACP reductase [Francisella halioticida]|uniref:3-oxoacyl-ACP reductase n=1 Tax=Francisella halioticida TaxID=549298 RepID=A0ABN5AYU4_9GAMM|nr:3-oxoacyl-ACP reductase FabG [Francisella halioticida]ASG68880.1 3-oxoacyl-ACP reductase [Francisella halioticida]BCD91869.1 3-ketoacyl-ACP reductase [Francisella halioticida]
MKRILITGASKGIGKALALKLASQKRHITIHYNKDLNGAKNVQEQILDMGYSADIISFDVSNNEQTMERITNYIDKKGAFYGIVNNAGVCKDSAFPAMSKEEWFSVLDVNLDSFFNVLKPCIMPMIQLRKGGRIINMSSVSGVIGNRGQVNYSAAKAGIIGASKALAVELAKRKITVNCIAPGLIETEMTNKIEHYDEIVKHIPMKRAGTVDEVACLAEFLMSDSASYITRQVISVNGGLA